MSCKVAHLFAFFWVENNARKFFHYFQQVILRKEINYGNKYQFVIYESFHAKEKSKGMFYKL